MSEPPRLSRLHIMELVRLWGSHLPAGYDADITVAGGAWMVLQGLRHRTRDIDVLMGMGQFNAADEPALSDIAPVLNLQHHVLHYTAQRAITDFTHRHPRIPIDRLTINEDISAQDTLPGIMCLASPAVRVRGTYDPRRGRRGYLHMHMLTHDSMLATKLDHMRIGFDYRQTGISQDRDDITLLLKAQGVDLRDHVGVLRHLIDVSSRHFAASREIDGPQRYVATLVGANPWRVSAAKVRLLQQQNLTRMVAGIRRMR